jgi:hypothetical protein
VTGIAQRAGFGEDDSESHLSIRAAKKDLTTDDSPEKTPNHEGHEVHKGKNLHSKYVVSVVLFVVKILFSVDSQINAPIRQVQADKKDVLF